MRRFSSKKLGFLFNLAALVAMVFSSLSPVVTRPVYAAVATPQLLTPANNSVTYASTSRPRALPTFTWKPVSGAVSYDVWISAQSGFNDFLYKIENTSSTTFSPYVANLPDATDLFWRVRAKDKNGLAGSWSTTWIFRKDWKKFDASTPNTTQLQKPTNNAVISYNDIENGDIINRPSFSWTQVLGATHYLLWLSRNPDFTDLVGGYPVSVTNNAFQPLVKPADGTYYWRVTPMQTGSPDWTGQDSETRVVKFNYTNTYIPQPIEPSNGSTPTLTPTFSWEPVRGAQLYILQTSTKSDFSSDLMQYYTLATSLTPTVTYPNDTDYYWRVRARSNNSDAPNTWSTVYKFKKQWYDVPTLLTPVDAYPRTSEPIFSWTPVKGAAKYYLEILDTNMIVRYSYNTANTFYTPPHNICGLTKIYWRVTPVDASNNNGKPTSNYSFDCDATNSAPVQFYPMYYYTPNPELNPHDDHTAPLPLFMWRRVLDVNNVQASSYEIQVGDYFFSNPWTLTTENLAAIPNLQNVLTPNTDYYWRVRTGGTTPGPWSQKWLMRFDPTLLPAATNTIQPLRPVDDSEWTEMTPVFEWLPLKGANKYHIQISQFEDLTNPVQDKTVDYPTFVPTAHLPFGTYYWRVQGMNGASPVGSWSVTMRFQVAAQSRWLPTRQIGASTMPIIATDAPGDMTDVNYDLTNLSITQGADSWHFRFNVNPAGADMAYVLYIDTDHKDNSGGSTDPRGYTVTTVAAHKPEYVIYVEKKSGTFSLVNTWLYRWTGTAWALPVSMDPDSMAGNLINLTGNALELGIRGSNIGQNNYQNSVSVSLFSVKVATGSPAMDTVPSDPNVTFTNPATATGSVKLSRFISVSDKVALMGPPNKQSSDPVTYQTVPLFFWQPPVETNIGCDPRYIIDVAIDPSFTTFQYQNMWMYSTSFAFVGDLRGDNTYYWRVHPNYYCGGQWSWSEGSGLARVGKGAQNITNTTGVLVPQFSWDNMEGVQSYFIQIDDNFDFSSPLVQEWTNQTAYTPMGTAPFQDGTRYYWRVQAAERSDDNILDGWSNIGQFTVTRGVPNNLVTIPQTTNYTPTFCWSPVQDALSYYIAVSYDQDFNLTYADATTEQSCYTPTFAFHDGKFYWHVLMRDGSNKPGGFSTRAEYVKESPISNPVSPLSYAGQTPVFKWTQIYGTKVYQIQVARDENFSYMALDTTTPNTEFSVLSPLNLDDYYWRVRMFDRDDRPGPFTQTVHITSNKIKVFLPYIVH